MKRLNYILSAFVLMSILVIGCKKDDPVAQPDPKKTMAEFPFIGEGHLSTYLMNLGGLIDTSTTIFSTQIDDVEWMVIAGNTLGADTTIVYAEGDFLMSYSIGEDPSTAVKLLKRNAQVGENWVADNITNVITGVDMSMTVAAGTFNSVELAQITPSNDTSMVYYTIEDGIIQQEFDAIVLVVYLELYSKNF